MDSIKVGEGENGENDNAQVEAPCICGMGGPHTLKCAMNAKGLRTVTVNFGLPTAPPQADEE